MKNAKTVVPVFLTLVGLGVGFGSGYFYRNHQLQKMRGNFAGGNANFQRFTPGRNGMGNGMFRGGGVAGTILSMDEKSFTVKLPDGSSKIVFFTDKTTYSNTQTANKSDIKVGGEVAVFGAPNSDGSVTATNVQLNPMFFKPEVSPLPSAQ